MIRYDGPGRHRGNPRVGRRRSGPSGGAGRGRHRAVTTLAAGLAGLTLLAGAALALAQEFPRGQERRAGVGGGDPGGFGAAHPYNGQFTFTRIRFGQPSGFGGGFRGQGAMWAHDYPRADRNFMSILEHVTELDARLVDTNVLDADDPRLMQFPVAYLVEPGWWNPTESEVAALREYLLKGGFLFLDDFGGPREWANTEHQFRRILPEHTWGEVDGTHPIFNAFFNVPNPENLVNYRGTPIYLALFEENDPSRRILVMANYNNDIGEFWEYSDTGLFAIDLSNKAYQIGVNYIIYALSR